MTLHTHHHPQDYPIACLRLLGMLPHEHVERLAKALTVERAVIDPDHVHRTFPSWPDLGQHLHQGVDTYWIPNEHTVSVGCVGDPGHIRTRRKHPYAHLPNGVLGALMDAGCAFSWRTKLADHADGALTWSLSVYHPSNVLVEATFVGPRIDTPTLRYPKDLIDHAGALALLVFATKGQLSFGVPSSAHDHLALCARQHHALRTCG